MSDIMQQTGEILDKSQELLKEPMVKGAISGFLKWIGDKIFANKKSVKEKLALIEQQKADTNTISGLKANLEFVLEDNEELRKELEEKVKAIDLLLKQSGIETNKTNSQVVSGDGAIGVQDVSDSSNVTINQGNNKKD